MKLAIASFTAAGETLGEYLTENLRAAGHAAEHTRLRAGSGENLAGWTAERFLAADGLLYIGAAGIAVRAVAPHLKSKAVDPAVLALDEKGLFVIPLVSGHIGGGVALARLVARLTGGQAAVTTATDINGVFAVDSWAAAQGLRIPNPERIKRVSAKLLRGEHITVFSEFPIAGGAPEGVRLTEDAAECDVRIGYRQTEGAPLLLVPPVLTAGIGCRKGTPARKIREAFDCALRAHSFLREAVCRVCSIDLKAEEPGLREFCENAGLPFRTYSAGELRRVGGDFTPSALVERVTGVDNVCERSAVLGGGRLVAEKTVLGGVTVAFAAAGPDLDFTWETAAGPSPLPSRNPHGKRYTMKKKLTVVGLGPGAYEQMTPQAAAALEEADILCGYTGYIESIRGRYPEKELLHTPMTQEIARCRAALQKADAGHMVAMVCSGDAGVYGMASPVLELAPEYPDVEIEIVPGITAALSGAAVLGAPLGHDFAVISLSDLLTPWELIERRLEAAAAADFVICLYNPSSKKRADYLRRACDILLQHRDGGQVCGIARNIGREGGSRRILTLRELRDTPVDMFTTVFIGNSRTQAVSGRMVTPRGYARP